jgi:hypothetical protein
MLEDTNPAEIMTYIKVYFAHLFSLLVPGFGLDLGKMKFGLGM